MFLYLDTEDVLSYFGALSLYRFLALSAILSQMAFMANHEGLIICFNIITKMDNEFRTYGRDITYIWVPIFIVMISLFMLFSTIILGRLPVDITEALNIFIGYYYPIYIRTGIFGIGTIMILIMYWHFFLLKE